jgi:hypothetical protein
MAKTGGDMLRSCIFGGIALLLGGAALAQEATSPAYTPDGKMLRPQDYRSWVFLSSGFDMSYADAEVKAHEFNNVFVNREAYEAFQRTGAWPDKTQLVLETRLGSGDDPVLKHGQFQAGLPTGMEIHVKDDSKGGWAFYAFGRDRPSAAMIPKNASCYSCHADNARFDTTFTQFYPGLGKPAAQ